MSQCDLELHGVRILDGGRLDAATAATIREVLDAHPQANFAVATGPGSGVFVVDIDGKEGVESYRRLTAERGKLPWTPWVKTPRGCHLWLKYLVRR